MKLTAASSILFSTMTTVLSSFVELPNSIQANSAIGKQVLANARRLENADDEVDYTWVADYSIKFQGCHHITQWNAEADGDEDVRISTKRLIRFRLCPSDYCDDSSAGGCSSGYGEYIVDMDTYLAAYLQNKEQVEEWTCENLQENVCACNNDDGNQQDDQFDEEACLNKCYYNNGADYCVEVEQDDAAGEAFELADWAVCAQYDVPNDDAGRRLDADEVQYFIGPYCADQGGDVVLGMFTDDTCSQFADNYGGKNTYKGFTGEALPYSSESILGLDCIACMEPKDANNDGDQQDEDETTEMCEQMYVTAGKCESGLSINDKNENACSYMQGIKIVRNDGIVQVVSASGSSSAAAFIGVFAAAFFIAGGYAYYLKTKLEKINLSS